MLLHTSRELLTGRGVSMAPTERMRLLVSRQAGVVGVLDIFAIVVGPGSLIVDGDVIFDDARTVNIDGRSRRVFGAGVAAEAPNDTLMGRVET